MNYKETLFFVGKCLTISYEEHNKVLIEEKLKSGKVNWESVVKLSTEHYVFPALYCNLKRVNFLEYLPEDLVDYMKHITKLNRERNQQIIEQAKEINNLLKENNITPIFLKGTGNLLEGLYEDIGERMVGDIDFIVSKEEYNSSIKALKQQGYNNKKHLLEDLKLGKHYPRLIHPNKNMAVEVHFKILKDSYNKDLSFKELKKNSMKLKENIYILKNNYQLLHLIFNKQINDLGYWYKNISLRNSYDVFLFSYKVDTLKSIKNYNHYLKISNSFLASICYILNTEKITYVKTKEASVFVNKQIKLIDNPNKMKLHKKKWDLYFINKSRIQKLKIAFYNKNMRKHFLNILKTKPNS